MTGQIELFRYWEYEEDSGSMMAKCPECGKRMPIYRWNYGNFYKFCPYCGQALEEGDIMRAGKRIYGWTKHYSEMV